METFAVMVLKIDSLCAKGGVKPVECNSIKDQILHYSIDILNLCHHVTI